MDYEENEKWLDTPPDSVYMAWHVLVVKLYTDAIIEFSSSEHLPSNEQ